MQIDTITYPRETNDRLPILNVCLICNSGMQYKEGFRLSHGYCATHAEEVALKWKEEMNGIINNCGTYEKNKR